MRDKLIKLAQDSGLFDKQADALGLPDDAGNTATANNVPLPKPAPRIMPSMGAMPSGQQFRAALPAPVQAPSFKQDMGKVLNGLTPTPFQQAIGAMSQVTNKGFDKAEDAIVSTQGSGALGRYRQTRDATRTNGVGHPGDMARQVVTEVPFLSSTAAAGFLRTNPLSKITSHPAATAYSMVNTPALQKR